MKRKENSGFTLIEMMVAMSILAIILMGVAWIMAQMSKSFSNSQREVQLQDDMQATYSIVSGLIKEAQAVRKNIEGGKDYGSIIVDDANNRVYIFEEKIDRASSDMITQVPVGGDDSATVYVIQYDSSNRKLYLATKTYNPSTYVKKDASGKYTINAAEFSEMYKSVDAIDPNNLLANHVDSFEVVNNEGKGYAVVELDLSYGRRHASITQNVYLRNSNITIEPATPTPDDVTATVTGEPTTTGTPTLDPGETGFTLTGEYSAWTPDVNDISSHEDITVNYYAGNKTENKTFTDTVETVTVKCKICNSVLTLDSDSRYRHDCPEGTPNKTHLDFGESENNDNAVRETNTTTYERNETVNTTEKYGNIEIKNTSLTKDYDNVEVIVYFEEDDAKFLKNGGSYLTANTVNTNGKRPCKFYYSEETGGNQCKYIKISIPKLKKAEGSTDKPDEIKYDSYSFDFSWVSSSGNNPVLCAYAINSTTPNSSSKDYVEMK